MAGAATPAGPEAVDIEEVELRWRDGDWVARVLGRAAGGGSAPLLLVGFWPEAERSGAHHLEALVGARSLESLGTSGLEHLLEGAVAPPDPKPDPTPKRRGRGRGGGGRPGRPERGPDAESGASTPEGA